MALSHLGKAEAIEDDVQMDAEQTTVACLAHKGYDGVEADCSRQAGSSDAAAATGNGSFQRRGGAARAHLRARPPIHPAQVASSSDLDELE